MRTILILIMLAFAVYFFLHADRPNVRQDIRAAQAMWKCSEIRKFLK